MYTHTHTSDAVFAVNMLNTSREEIASLSLSFSSASGDEAKMKGVEKKAFQI